MFLVFTCRQSTRTGDTRKYMNVPGMLDRLFNVNIFKVSFYSLGDAKTYTRVCVSERFKLRAKFS
jgi:hypothetical protein